MSADEDDMEASEQGPLDLGASVHQDVKLEDDDE